MTVYDKVKEYDLKEFMKEVSEEKAVLLSSDYVTSGDAARYKALMEMLKKNREAIDRVLGQAEAEFNDGSLESKDAAALKSLYKLTDNMNYRYLYMVYSETTTDYDNIDYLNKIVQMMDMDKALMSRYGIVELTKTVYSTDDTVGSVMNEAEVIISNDGYVMNKSKETPDNQVLLDMQAVGNEARHDVPVTESERESKPKFKEDHEL